MSIGKMLNGVFITNNFFEAVRLVNIQVQWEHSILSHSYLHDQNIIIIIIYIKGHVLYQCSKAFFKELRLKILFFILET
jgi:hypothetical protein